ncbi:glycosyltransferase [Ostreibacterium oceani]|uniref:Glycosyltransferase n=1 Tax=Ostreibacterium oceani TaxID=2654998 RepID=A0A6N7F0F1_9GAMM|nr:glycosyltransferase [Ostreibacterium oceani]MPV85326.1 glycosyltransferase [Ostreibacterium oceani]
MTDAITFKPYPTRPTISVVLPIYTDTAMTIACIESALPNIIAHPHAILVLVNDASPEADMATTLAQIVARYPEHVVLLTNEQNLGFVGSVNRGMQYQVTHDVVLLNSDVIVANDWLERLQREIYRYENAATMTPLSNNTTICTFPDFLQDNVIPFDLSVAQIDAVFATSTYACVDAPTGVGFCMYIKRSALNAVGYFDEAAFGRGYGEENDFCQRAIAQGLVNYITPNLYVYHQGGVSFGEEKQQLIENACKIIDQRYPSYHADVQKFIAADPLRPARLYQMAKLIASFDLPKVLHISHGMGGGVDQHIEELSAILSTDAAHLLLVPHDDKGGATLSLSTSRQADRLYFQLPEQIDNLHEILRQLGITLIHYHHTFQCSSDLFVLPKILDLPYQITIHDYYLLGGNPTLSDETGVYPGYFDETLENPLYPYPKNMTRESFRATHRELLEQADRVIFPSQAARQIFGDIYHLPHVIIAYHAEPERKVTQSVKPIMKKTRYQVGILGAVSREKGADFLEAVAVYAKKSQYPIDFIILGYGYKTLKNVNTTGPYVRDELLQLMQHHDIDMIFFPARWPETYSYTLSYALHAQLPIFAPNVGAFPERLSGRDWTQLFNYLGAPENTADALWHFIQSGGQVDTIDTSTVQANFYQTNYLSLSLSPKSSLNIIPEQLFNIDAKPKFILKSGEKSAVWLWKIYTHPKMRWVNYVIPFSVRRAVKRLLSRQPIHDLVKKHDK